MALRMKRLKGGGGGNPGCIICSRCTCAAWLLPAHVHAVLTCSCLMAAGGTQEWWLQCPYVETSCLAMNVSPQRHHEPVRMCILAGLLV